MVSIYRLVCLLFLHEIHSQYVVVPLGGGASSLAGSLTSRLSKVVRPYGSQNSLQTVSFPLTQLVNQLKTINNKINPANEGIQDHSEQEQVQPNPPSTASAAIPTPQGYVLPEILPRSQPPSETLQVGGPYAKPDDKSKPNKEYLTQEPSLVPGKVPVALLLQLYPEVDQDLDPNCCYWASDGNCAINADWMLRNCRKSCAAHGCAGCKDDHLECNNWMQAGQCQQNPNYMNYVCRHSCSQC